MSKITDLVEQIARPVVESQGCDLWDVEYIKEAGTWYLRVYIDKEGGVGISDCEAVSRALDPILDEEDPIPDSYVFEVGSAGAERALVRPEHFEKCLHEEVEVRLYQPRNGQKSVIGELIGYDNGTVTLLAGDETIEFGKKEMAQVKLHLSF